MSAPSRRKSHLRQETPDFPSTQTPQLNPTPKKATTLPIPSSNPQTRKPTSPTSHVSPPHHPPKQRPPSSPSPLNTRRGACFTSRHQPQTPTNQPQPSSCRPLSLRTPHSRRRQRTPARPHTKCDPNCRVQHRTSRKRANEMRGAGQFFVWDWGGSVRGCAQTAAVRIPCRGEGCKWMVRYQMRPVSGGFSWVVKLWR